MGRLSDTVIDAVIDQLFGGVAYTPPATLYIGLSTTAPHNDGSNVTEPVGNGYARVMSANNLTNWPAAAGRSKSNGTTIAFPAATGAWGSVTHFVVYDAATAGSFIGWGELLAPQNIVSGNTASFPPAAFVVSGPAS